jgi:hypothetical protein
VLGRRSVQPGLEVRAVGATLDGTIVQLTDVGFHLGYMKSAMCWSTD